MHRRIAAIANPQAARGRVARLLPQLGRRLRARLGEVTLRVTDSSGHATEIARELIEAGFDLIVAVGGDGTISEVANGFLRDGNPLRTDVQLGVLPVGTGGDMRRSLGIPRDANRAIEILAAGRPLTIDIGKAMLTGRDGSAVRRYFVNLASFGIGGEAAARAANPFATLGGKAGFLWATLRTVAEYRGRRVEIELDGSGEFLPFFISNVAVGNGRYHGGGMHPCPRALLDDGVLDVTVIDYLKPLEVLRDIRVLYSDDVYRLPKVHRLEARSLKARADQPTWVEVDGEPLGCLPIQIEVLPRRLNVLLSPSSPHFRNS
ncbi:MAG TPA: diacylglycerol kinase family protein [Terriglobia bacterium]|nr:diacylglycerol kinase family protein [Terriglobia bacterium]